MLVFAKRMGGEFRHVEPAERDRAGGIEFAQHGRIRGGDPSAADRRTGRGNLALAIEHVLVRQRHAMQDTDRPAALQRLVARSGAPQRLLLLDRDECIDLRLPRADSVQAGLRHLDRADPARLDEARDGGELQGAQIFRHERLRSTARRGSPPVGRRRRARGPSLSTTRGTLRARHAVGARARGRPDRPATARCAANSANPRHPCFAPAGWMGAATIQRHESPGNPGLRHHTGTISRRFAMPTRTRLWMRSLRPQD